MNINELTSRAAMHLPSHYKQSVTEDAVKRIGNFTNKNKSELLEISDSMESTTIDRWCASTLLAFLGDPRINGLNPSMINIPAATVEIGSSLDEIKLAHQTYESIGVKYEWLLKEYPKHLVQIAAFNIATYPVTNVEYLMFLNDSNHTDIPTAWKFGIYDPSKSNHPVYGIKPESADSYAAWLSKKTNRVFRLPTEYEWEYAAQGKTRREFPWGNYYAPDLANTLEAGFYTSTPVGLFLAGASPFGCHDMAGNVEEYVSTNYFIYPNGNPIKDDLGEDYRISRGGSFTRHADLARCKRRHGFFDKDIYVIGFRLAEDVNRFY